MSSTLLFYVIVTFLKENAIIRKVHSKIRRTFWYYLTITWISIWNIYRNRIQRLIYFIITIDKYTNIRILQMLELLYNINSLNLWNMLIYCWLYETNISRPYNMYVGKGRLNLFYSTIKRASCDLCIPLLLPLGYKIVMAWPNRLCPTVITFHGLTFRQIRAFLKNKVSSVKGVTLYIIIIIIIVVSKQGLVMIWFISWKPIYGSISCWLHTLKLHLLNSQPSYFLTLNRENINASSSPKSSKLHKKSWL